MNFARVRVRRRFGSGAVKSPRGVVRQRVAGEMNKTERRYADALEGRRLAGQIQTWKFEAINLRLADTTYYKPDFLVVENDGKISFHEVKGFWQDAARVKFKIAAQLYPWFSFFAVKYDRKHGFVGA